MGLLLGVLLAVDLYSSRVIRSQALRSAGDQLGSLLNLAQSRPPSLDTPELRAWTEWMEKSGARVTVIDKSGRLLADSEGSPEGTENYAELP